jgi:hypothetical protein
MKEKIQNKCCILDLPYCGHFFGSEQSAFIAFPEKEGFTFEADALNELLRERGLKSYLMPETVSKNKIMFCEHVCSKIISSSFCLVFTERNLPRSADVNLLYGMMITFGKIVVPLEKKDPDADRFSPLPVIVYSPDNFYSIAGTVIEKAFIKAQAKVLLGEFHRDEELQRYFLKQGLRVLPVEDPVTRTFYRIAYPLDFIILQGEAFVFFGSFDSLGYHEVSSRLRLLIQGLSEMKNRFETLFKNTLSIESMEIAYRIFSKISIETVVSGNIDISRLLSEIPGTTIPVAVISREEIREK